MQVIALFKAAKAKPPLPANAAPFSGAITWADGLLDRVSSIQPKSASCAFEVPTLLEYELYCSNIRDLVTIVLKRCEVQTMPAISVHGEGQDKLPAQIKE